MTWNLVIYIFFSRDVRFYENIFLFKLKNVHDEGISKDVRQFVKLFPFYDDFGSIVSDENQITGDVMI